MVDTTPAERPERKLVGLLAPASVAVVGVSAEGGFGKSVLDNLALLGFGGTVYAVNPRYDRLSGVPCRPSLSAIDEPVDAVAVAVPARAAEAVLSEAADRGIGNAVVYASGMGEGEEAGSGSARLAHLVRSRRIRLLGPNCLGYVNYRDRVGLWANPVVPERSGTAEGVALIAQSGNMALSIMTCAPWLPLCHVVSCGNQTDVTVAELIGHFVGEPGVKVLAVELEGVPDIERLKAAFEWAVLAGKPIVALRVGASQKGRRATVAHTGTLSASGDSYTALFRQYCVVEVQTLDELVATCTVLSSPKRVRGPGLTVFANSGGECGLVADVAARLGLRLPDVEPEAARRLAELLPEHATASNPLDVTASRWGDGRAQEEFTEELAGVPGTDAVICVSNYISEQSPAWSKFVDNVDGMARAAERVAVPVFGMSILSTIDRNVPIHLAAKGIAPLCGLEPGLRALAYTAEYAARSDRWKERHGQRAVHPVDHRRRAAALKLISGFDGKSLGESRSKELLRLYQIATPAGGQANTPAEAVGLARHLGFPLVMKLEAEGLHHKSDVGAVVVGVSSFKRVRAEFKRLIGLAAKREDAAVRIEKQVPHDLELIVGTTRERDLGPVVVLGIGGVFVEVLRDVSRRLVPLGKDEVGDMVTELRGADLLFGHRGRPGGDVDRLASFVAAFSEMLVELPEIVEVDLNPVAFDACTDEWIALDALVVKG